MSGYKTDSKKWNKYRLRYLNADGTKKFKMPPATLDLLLKDPKKFKSFCNGVGSKVGFWGKLTYHFIPNWCGLGFASIVIEADLHDVGYAIPTEFENRPKAMAYKASVDLDFYENICADAKTRSFLARESMEAGAWTRYMVVDKIGLNSFLAGKVILNEVKPLE